MLLSSTWIFVLVRTDDSGIKQTGITFILVDMKTPGIEVKPIITLDGDGQNDPNDIEKILNVYEKGSDMTIGWRKNRKDNYIKIISSKNHLAALSMLRQLQFGLLDMKIHDEFDPYGEKNVFDLYLIALSI